MLLDSIAPQVYNELPMDFGTLEEESQIVQTVVTTLHKKLPKVGVNDALFCSSLGIQSMNVIRVGLVILMSLGGSKSEAREMTRLIVSRLDNDYVNERCSPSLTKNLTAVFEKIKDLVPDVLLPSKPQAQYTEGTCHSYLVNQGNLDKLELCNALKKYPFKRPTSIRTGSPMPDYYKTVHFSCPETDGNFEQCIRVDEAPAGEKIDCKLINIRNLSPLLRGVDINATVTGVGQDNKSEVCETLQSRFLPSLDATEIEIVEYAVEESLEIVFRDDQ